MRALEFVWPVRVYWEDTDAGGVVFYANYLKFMERARTEWLRALGIEQGPLQTEHGVLLVIVSAEANYRRPARYGDLLQVTCKVAESRRASLSFEQRIYRHDVGGDVYRQEVGGELLLEGAVKVGCIDATTFRPRALPEIIVRELEK